MIVVQQITVDIVVGLFILLYIIHMRLETTALGMFAPADIRLFLGFHTKNLHRLSDSSCLCNLRMDRNAFGRLCFILEHSGGLTTTKHVTISEQVAMFLSIIAHHKKNCVVKHDFLRSGRTVSKHFHAVLKTIYKLTHVFLAKAIPIADDCADPRWRWFNTKEGTVLERTILINVLEVCNPNMQFIYVLSGWEGSAADSRVLRDAIHRPHGFRVPSGNYYLCYNGYANADGFLTPYRGVCYHLQEWDRGHGGLQNPRELFNLKHSSARNVIERAFGLLKVRWGILRSQLFYPIDTQNKIIFVCCLLHNFLRNEMPDDLFELEIPDEDNACPEANVECIGSIDTTTAWTS
ncbi:UNVERIFIED_CONTAM: hypothetical protein Sradi_0676500 [Sesamum radiatum]|uniref:DDE Tnp4 domain-containing protein n=1 Tax=Sesamum radiatum TaxID=300843 RepID=A0AAW2VP08_SESRA